MQYIGHYVCSGIELDIYDKNLVNPLKFSKLSPPKY